MAIGRSLDGILQREGSIPESLKELVSTPENALEINSRRRT
jgi:hypothetical protein